MMRSAMQLGRLVGLVLLGLVNARATHAEPTLELSFGVNTIRVSRTRLLSRSDVVDLNLAHDVVYGRVMTYRAIPLLSVIGKRATQRFDILEAAATDGYVSQLPMNVIKRGAAGGSMAWLAIEDAKHPWPALPKKKLMAKP